MVPPARRLAPISTRSFRSSSLSQAKFLESSARATWGVPPPGAPIPQRNHKPGGTCHTSWPAFTPTPNHARRSSPPDRRIDPPAPRRPKTATEAWLDPAKLEAVKLDLYLVNLVNKLTRRSVEHVSLPALLTQAREKAGQVLPVELKGEHVPKPDRKVCCGGCVKAAARALGEDEQDGVVMVAHVVGGGDGKGESRVVMSSGFAVGAGPLDATKGEGQMILTCMHPLEQVSVIAHHTTWLYS